MKTTNNNTLIEIYEQSVVNTSKVFDNIYSPYLLTFQTRRNGSSYSINKKSLNEAISSAFYRLENFYFRNFYKKRNLVRLAFPKYFFLGGDNIGTANPNMTTIKLLGSILGFKDSDFFKTPIIKNDANFTVFSISEFKELDELYRNFALFDLIQAVGRTRPYSNASYVIILSNIPHPEAEIYPNFEINRNKIEIQMPIEPI